MAKEKATKKQRLEELESLIVAHSDSSTPDLIESYIKLFQINEKNDLLSMSLDVTETGFLITKNGFSLPLMLPQESDLKYTLYLLNSILAPGQIIPLNIVGMYHSLKYSLYLESENSVKFIYTLMEFLAFGRKAPNIEYENYTASNTDPSLSWDNLYLLVEKLVENPEDESHIGNFISAMQNLAPDSWKVLSPLFNRESLKKNGITHSSNIAGENAPVNKDVAEEILTLLYNLFKDIENSAEDKAPAVQDDPEFEDEPKQIEEPVEDEAEDEEDEFLDDEEF